MSGFAGLRSVTLIVVACLALVLLQKGTFSLSPGIGSSGISTSKPPVKMTTDPIPKLGLHLRQTGTNPPKVAVKVTNNNDVPITILTWDSPLDQAALPLGLIEITPQGVSAPLELQRVQFRRVTPPGPESIVEIAAGKSFETEVELKEPTVTEDDMFAGKETATVVIKGTWMAVWDKARKEISDDEIGNMEQSFGGDFQSNKLEIKKKM